MQWSKIKTAIILLLAVVNLSLGISFAYALYTRGRVSGSDREALLPYLKNAGITLEDNALPTREKALDALEFSRDSAHEASIASKLLGQTEESNRGGGITVYSSRSGEAVFRRGGMFEIALFGGRELPSGSSEAEKAARALLKKAGIALPKGGVSVRREDAAYTVAFAYKQGSIAVKNAGIDVTFFDDRTVISGILLEGEGDAFKCETGSLIGLISEFAEICASEDLGVESIVRAYYCYWYTIDENGNGLLLPALAVVTPEGEYIFNAADRTLVK